MLLRSVLLLSMLVFTVLVFSVPGLSNLAQAEVYKWINAEGNPVYGDMPPAGVDAELIRRTPVGSDKPSDRSSPPEPTSISEYLDKLERQEPQPAAGQGSRTSAQNAPPSAQTAGAGGQNRAAGQAVQGTQTDSSDDKDYGSNPFDAPPSRKLSEQKDFIEQRNKQALEQHAEGDEPREKTIREQKIEAQQ